MIPQIFHAAAIATIVAVPLYGFLLVALTEREDRRIVLAATACGLALPPLIVSILYYPVLWYVDPHLGPVARAFWILLSAPLAEEPAKWLVLLLPPVRRALRERNAAVVALALGLGFAVGEFWTQTFSIWLHGDSRPALWIYVLYPFERTMAPVLHSGFVLFVVLRLAQGRSLWPGMLLGVCMHFLANFAAFFYIGPGWPWLHVAWLVGSRLLSIATFTFLLVSMAQALGPKLRRLFLGKPIACPSCSEVYERPWVAFNCGVVSYERCPHCRTLQWVRTPVRSARTLPEAAR